MAKPYYVISPTSSEGYEAPSEVEMEFMLEFYALCMKYHTHTHDDEWSPSCFFSPLTPDGMGVSFDVITKDGAVEFWYDSGREVQPFGEMVKNMFEDEIETHVAYMETTTYVYHSPIFNIYYVVGESGVRRVAVLSSLYDSEGISTRHERVL